MTSGRRNRARERESTASLSELARKHGTDKEGPHSYTEAYERHLGHLRNAPITLLEIGVGGYADPDQGGESLRMWKEYFPFARIIGLDIEDKAGLAEDRITILRGDQGDTAFLERLASVYGPFDVVIDDGSHRCNDVNASFAVLYPHLTEDGIYAIEDLQTSYWETYGGSSSPNRHGTSMTMLQSLVDGLNYAEFDIPSYEPTHTDRWTQSVTFYHNLAIIQKGANLEPSNLLPPHPRQTRCFAKSIVPSPSRTLRSIVPPTIRPGLVKLVHALRDATHHLKSRRR